MQTIVLGDVTVTRVAEWAGAIMPPTDFVPASTTTQWDRHRSWLEPDFWRPDADEVRAAIQTWLVRSGGRTILVDTGVGNGKQRPHMSIFHQLDTAYLDNLASAGVEPEDVDLVVNTHVHSDHVGWNTRLDGGKWVPTFPNATYLVPARDVAFFDPDGPGRPKSPESHANVFEDSITPIRRAGQLQPWDDTHTIDENLTLELAAGHTPGSSVLWLASGSDRAAFVGDLVHTPIQVVEPDLNSCFCEDEGNARGSRLRVLARAAEIGALVLPAHFGGHGAVEVRPDGDGFAITGWAGFPRV